MVGRNVFKADQEGYGSVDHWCLYFVKGVVEIVEASVLTCETRNVGREERSKEGTVLKCVSHARRESSTK